MKVRLLLINIFLLLLLINFIGCKEKSENKKVEIPKIVNKKPVKPLSERQLAKKRKKLDEYLTDLQEKRGLNGVALVAKGSQVILQKSYGYSDFKKKDTLSHNSIFQLASVSKQFTAAAVMLLKQKGLINYDDSIQRFFKDFPYHGITIRQLLTHSSGLTNYTYFCDKVWDRKTTISNSNVIRLMCEHKPASYYSPGVRYDYSNTGYMLLAALVEKVSKMKFEDFMQKYIFQPCKMTNTFVYNHATPVSLANMVEAYNHRRRKIGKTYLDGVYGDKGVYSTVEDMYKWDRALHNEVLFKEETLKEAFTPAFEKKKNKDNYGFGWRIKDYKNDKVVWHGGWWEGYKTIFIRNLKDEVVIVVLTNSLSGHLKSEEILDAYYD